MVADGEEELHKDEHDEEREQHGDGHQRAKEMSRGRQCGLSRWRHRPSSAGLFGEEEETNLQGRESAEKNVGGLVKMALWTCESRITNVNRSDEGLFLTTLASHHKCKGRETERE